MDVSVLIWKYPFDRSLRLETNNCLGCWTVEELRRSFRFLAALFLKTNQSVMRMIQNYFKYKIIESISNLRKKSKAKEEQVR